MSAHVFIVSSRRLYRDALADALGRRGVQIVGTGSSVERAAARTGTAVVVVDLPLREGLLATKRLRQQKSPAKVLLLGVPETAGPVIACAEAGVAGYLPDDSSFDDLVAAIESVACGETLCPPRVVASLFSRLAALAARRLPTGPRQLTRREMQVLDLIEQGLSNKEIAQYLCIELQTVKNHVHNILRKLDVHRRDEAVARASGESGVDWLGESRARSSAMT
jgi:two-component system, NarL family, nitrate/nitrite response regulator NarL